MGVAFEDVEQNGLAENEAFPWSNGADQLSQEVEVTGTFGSVEVLISALEHYSYCPRQCGLIHIEKVWEENLYTVRGRIAHERVDLGDGNLMDGITFKRNVPLWSERYGLYGKADLVELRSSGPYPVEYKVGRQRNGHSTLQLCAQALCLEEMMGIPVPLGALYFHATRRRHEVTLDESLRRQTIAAVYAIREMLESSRLPEAPNDPRCPDCSLLDACLPSIVAEPARLRGFQGALYIPYGIEGGEERA
jgi:CRISPR-associated exonuclease Cas4